MKIKDLLSTVVPMTKYNTEIIFANKFIWFLLASLVFYMLTMFLSVWNNAELNTGLVYQLLFFPSLLIVFYPTSFSIQNDEDSKILEIIFGIPNYRFKVWLIRLVMIYILVYLLLIVFAFIGSIMLYEVNPFQIANSIMLPVLFLGNLAFMFSTIIRSGSGTSIVMIVVGLASFFITRNGILQNSMWDIFLNPFSEIRDMNMVIWQDIIFKNRMFLAVGCVVALLIAMQNLQKRERFV
ncbi:MAG TPA: hypothetical protein DCF91_09860 [Porphyromonadaceae bacterium]|nr:hypothetical protein [Porphyromonadaceae bacterium]